MGAAPREAAKDGGRGGTEIRGALCAALCLPQQGIPTAPHPQDSLASTVPGEVAAAAVCLRTAEQGGEASTRNP